MSDMKSKAEQSADNAKAKVKAAAEGLSDAAESAAEQISDAGEAAADEVSRLKEQASNAYDEAHAVAAAWEQRLEETIRRRPIQTVLIAAGVGALIGCLFRRR
jgi:ElaB/YqjD/DUF883 family membrane-anchored ribosome-binding protein